MTPFRDAMSLIDSDAGKLLLLMHDSKMLPEVVRSALLWRNIEKPS